MKINVVRGFGIRRRHAQKVHGPGRRSQPKLTFGAAVIATGAPAFVPPIPGARSSPPAASSPRHHHGIWRTREKMAIVGGELSSASKWRESSATGTEILMLERQPHPRRNRGRNRPRATVGLLEKELTVVTSASSTACPARPAPCRWVTKPPRAETKTFAPATSVSPWPPGKRPTPASSAWTKPASRSTVPRSRSICAAQPACRISSPLATWSAAVLAHTAATQGRVAASNLLGRRRRYDQDRDCGVTFSRRRSRLRRPER